MELILPPRLQPDDTIGIASPSWFGGEPFVPRLMQGVRALEEMGFKVHIAPHALNNRGYVSDTAQNRAADLHQLFADPAVKAIIASIGGDHSCQLLPLLDFDLIRANPKVFMGFSDITVLNVAIHARTGLVTFNGPAIMTDFAEVPEMFSYTREAFLRAADQTEPAGRIHPSSEWTDERVDWLGEEATSRPRRMEPNPGWTWLKPGMGEGRLIGGCLESLQHLRGTDFWPDFEERILFLEISEERPSPETVDGLLADYENMDILPRLKGLLFGRPYQYENAQRTALREILLERCRAYDFPILADMDFGHTSPQFPLPLGIRARIDTHARRFELLEAAVC